MQYIITAFKELSIQFRSLLIQSFVEYHSYWIISDYTRHEIYPHEVYIIVGESENKQQLENSN